MSGVRCQVKEKWLLAALLLSSFIVPHSSFPQEPIQPTRVVASEVQILTNQLPPVSVVSVYTIGAQGAGNYYYWIVAKYGMNRPAQDQPAGDAPPTTGRQISNAPSVLNGTNYVRVCWNPVPDATGYDVLRTATSGLPNGAAAIGVALNTAGNCVSDQGAGLSSYTLNTYNPAKTPTSLKYARLDMPRITPPLDNPPAGQCRFFVNNSTNSFDAIDQNGNSCFPSGAGGLTPHNLLSVTHSDTQPYTPPEIGDMIRGSSAQLWERFARGNASQLLATDTATNLPAWKNFNFYQDSLTPVNSVGRLGVNFISGSNVTIAPADDAANNRVSYTISAVGGATSCAPGEIMTGITAGGAAICAVGFAEGRAIGMDLPIKQSGSVRQFIKTIINNTSCGFGATGVTDPSASIPWSTFFITANTSLLAAPISCFQTYVGSFNAEQDPILWSTLTTEGTSSSDMFWGFSNMSGPNACGFPDATPPLPPVDVVQVGFAGYHGGNWKGFVHDGVTYSTCDTGISADVNITNVPVKLSYSNATGVTKFYMSNLLKCSVTLDLPATNIYMQRCVITRGTATARTLRLGSVFWTYKEP